MRTAILAALLLATASALAADPMERGAILLERNHTDDDLEIRMEISAGSEGFASLTVTAPDGRRVLDLRSVDSKLGIRHIILETPEPVGGVGVEAAFPAGTYLLTGTSGAGADLEGRATLSHTLPEPARIESPTADDRDVPATGTQLRWSKVAEVVHYLVVLEHERSRTEIRAQLPAAVNSLTLPDGFLVPGRTYKVAVGTVARNGNRTFVEQEFSVRR